MVTPGAEGMPPIGICITPPGRSNITGGGLSKLELRLRLRELRVLDLLGIRMMPAGP